MCGYTREIKLWQPIQNYRHLSEDSQETHKSPFALK
jgi:hypothetical protein